MLRIRLFRVGKKNQPFFKIVAIDKKAPPRGGRPLEILGFYNPLTKEKGFKKDRILHWISVGAKPSDTVYNLLITENILKGKKIPSHKKAKSKKEKAKEPKEAEKPKETVEKAKMEESGKEERKTEEEKSGEPKKKEEKEVEEKAKEPKKETASASQDKE